MGRALNIILTDSYSLVAASPNHKRHSHRPQTNNTEADPSSVWVFEYPKGCSSYRRKASFQEGSREAGADASLIHGAGEEYSPRDYIQNFLSFSTIWNELNIIGFKLQLFVIVIMIDFTGSPQWYQPYHLILEKEGSLGVVYLGDINAALDLEELTQNNVTTVITAAEGMDQVQYPAHFRHIRYPLLDSKSENISKYFDQVFEVIQSARQKGNLLVHCAAGVSRSATLVIAYLMRKNGWTFKKAIEFVRAKRSTVCPNLGFELQLKQYEKLVCKKNGANKSTILKIYDSVRRQEDSSGNNNPEPPSKSRFRILKHRKLSNINRKPEQHSLLQDRLDLQNNFIIMSLKTCKYTDPMKPPTRASKPRSSNLPARNIYTSG